MPKIRVGRVVIVLLVFLSVVTTPVSADTQPPPLPKTPNDWGIGVFVDINARDTTGTRVTEWTHDPGPPWWTTGGNMYGNLLAEDGCLPYLVRKIVLILRVWVSEPSSESEFVMVVRSDQAGATVIKTISTQSFEPGWNSELVAFTEEEVNQFHVSSLRCVPVTMTVKFFGPNKVGAGLTDALLTAKYWYSIPIVQKA